MKWVTLEIMKSIKLLLGSLSIGIVIIYLSKIDGSMELQLANKCAVTPASSCEEVEEDIELLPPSFLGMCQLLIEDKDRLGYIETLSDAEFECFDSKIKHDLFYAQEVLRECQHLSSEQKRLLRIHLFNLHCVYQERVFMKARTEGQVEMSEILSLSQLVLTSRLRAVADIIANDFKTLDAKQLFGTLQSNDTHEKIAFTNNVQGKTTEIDEKYMQAIEAQFQAFCSKSNLDASERNDLE